MLIAIEGLDGSGKSSVTAHLVEMYGFERMEKRAPLFQSCITAMKKQRASPLDMHVSYLMCLGYASQAYRERTDTKPQIVETWLAGEVHAYKLHAEMRQQVWLDFNYQAMPIIMPDHVFYLKPDYKTRLERLYERNMRGLADPFDERTKNPNAEDSFYACMERFYDNYHIINSSGSVESSCAAILACL